MRQILIWELDKFSQNHDTKATDSSPVIKILTISSIKMFHLYIHSTYYQQQFYYIKQVMYSPFVKMCIYEEEL